MFIKKSMKNIIKENGIIIAFFLVFIFASVTYPDFLQIDNINNVLRQISIIGIVTIGMTYVIISGGIDLSVGSIVAVTSIIAAQFSNFSVLLAISLPIIAGIAAGYLNSLLITKIPMAPFIATLATMMGFRGLAYILTGTITIGIENASDSFNFIGDGVLFDILPIPTLIFIIITLLGAYILKYRAYGRNVYAIGGNYEAAKMMGIRVEKVKTITYTICGFLAGIAGLILCSRLRAGQPTVGTGYELKAIAAVVLGGTYITGGVGKISGSFFGILILGFITNIFNLQGNVTVWWENTILGILMLIIVLIQSITDKGLRIRKGNKS